MYHTLISNDPNCSDYTALFFKYDSDSDDLLVKEDLMKIMIESGMKYVTHAEASFAFNLIAKFKNTLNIKTWLNWTKSMQGLGQKRLIQYS